MSQVDRPGPHDDDAWWARLAGVSARDGLAPAVVSGLASESSPQDAHFAQQLGDALRRQSLAEQQAELPPADPAEDARRRAALLARARQAGLLAPRGEVPGSRTLAGGRSPGDNALDTPAVQPQPRPSAMVPKPSGTRGYGSARPWRRPVLGLGMLASVVLLAALWWTGRPVAPSGPPPEVLRGGAVTEAIFERPDAASAARQAQAVLEAAGLVVEASRRPDEQGFARVLEFDVPAAPAPSSTAGPAAALAAMGLPAWQSGPQRWVFREPAPLQREGAASKVTKPAQ